MARAGMTNLITHIRALCNIGTADYTIGVTNYFSDDQIQGYLDEQRDVWREVELWPYEDRISGGYSYTEYDFKTVLGGIEENQTGSGWALVDGNGETVTGYTVNYAAKMITFSSDQGNTAYYLACRSYDLERTAAAIWEKIAAFERGSVDWKSDNHDIKAEQRYQHAMGMAKHWKKQARSGMTRLVRVDLNVVD